MISTLNGSHAKSVELDSEYAGVVFCLEPTSEELALLREGKEIEKAEVELSFEFI